MRTIIIEDDILTITFVHAQELDKNKFIQIPSIVLENIIDDWVRKQPIAASAPFGINTDK